MNPTNKIKTHRLKISLHSKSICENKVQPKLKYDKSICYPPKLSKHMPYISSRNNKYISMLNPCRDKLLNNKNTFLYIDCKKKYRGTNDRMKEVLKRFTNHSLSCALLFNNYKDMSMKEENNHDIYLPEIKHDQSKKRKLILIKLKNDYYNSYDG